MPMRSILKWLSIFKFKIVKDSQRRWKHWNKVTFNESSFDREYESKWSGTVEDAFFRAEQFDRARILNQPEYEHSGRSNKNAQYVLSVDVGRKGQISCPFKISLIAGNSYC